MVYSVEPQINQVCYYKKAADLAAQKVECFFLNSMEDGKYKFDKWVVISVRAFRELLNKTLDSLSIE